MYGNDYTFIDYAKQYPSTKKYFHNWGIGAANTAVYPPGTIPQEWPGLGDPPFAVSNSEPWLTKSVHQTLIDLGHYKEDKSNSQQYLTILKIDVEGAEWDAVTGFLETFSDQLSQGFVKQFLVEWHWDQTNNLKRQRHKKLLKKLKSFGFKPWKVVTHTGSECCLDVSYVWSKK